MIFPDDGLQILKVFTSESGEWACITMGQEKFPKIFFT